MSKSLNPIKNAIKGLQIHKPFDLRGSNKPEFKSPPIQPPQFEHTQNDYAESKSLVKAEDSSGGFFMLAHNVFKDPRVQKLSGDAFRLFIWMSVNAWRFKESNGELRASVGYASVGAGISKSSVSRAVILLQAAGFIQLVTTDYRKGNTWKVSNLALYQNDHSQNEDEYNNSLITLKNSLKNEIESETLRDHFENLKPQAKRESEQAAFGSVRKYFFRI